MWFSFSASFSHSCATLHWLCMREPVGHNFQNCWRRWEGKIHEKALQIDKRIQYLSVMSQVSSKKYCKNHFSIADGVEHPTMPVDRGLEVCEFQTAQHWDLRNNQLRSTLGSRSDSLGCCWGAASGASFLSPKVGFFETKVKNVWLWARMIRCRCRNVSCMQKFGEWDRWIHEGQMVGANESSAQCQLMTFFHSQVTTTVTVSRFPLFFEVTNLQCSNGASVADSSKATKAKPVLTIPADGNVCLFVFLIFLVLTRKRPRNKNVTIDLRLLSSKIFKDDNS